jgi:hypothetical protein
VGVEVSPRGSAAPGAGGGEPYRAAVARESALEPAENRQRAGEARTCRRQGHHREIHAEASSATTPSPVGDVEDLSPQLSPGTIAIDFRTVPTVTFNVLYIFFALSLDRRRVLHVNVTADPYAAWAAQQIVNAIGAQSAPARLIRDLTCRSPATRRSRAPSNRPAVARSSRFRASVGSTTATRGLRDCHTSF